MVLAWKLMKEQRPKSTNSTMLSSATKYLCLYWVSALYLQGDFTHWPPWRIMVWGKNQAQSGSRLHSPLSITVVLVTFSSRKTLLGPTKGINIGQGSSLNSAGSWRGWVFLPWLRPSTKGFSHILSQCSELLLHSKNGSLLNTSTYTENLMARECLISAHAR